MISPHQALDRVRQWAAIDDIGNSALPMLVVNFAGVGRSLRQHEADSELASLIVDAPWVNVAVVDPDLDPVLAPLVDSFDVIVGVDAEGQSVVDIADADAAVAVVAQSIEASPTASVELVRLLRNSHTLPVAQALHAESLVYAMLQTTAAFQSWLASRERKSVPALGRAVVVERTDSLLHITLNRPERRNALNVAMRDELMQALELLDIDRGLDGAIMTGAGANFGAGGDLDEFGTTPSPAIGHHVRMMRSLPAMAHRVRDRLRVHVHGACVGAGIELPAFASTVIAHPNATFRLPEVEFGLVPGAGGTVSVTRRCGRQRSAWLGLTGRAIDARTALRWQLVDRVDESVFSTGG